MMLSLSQGYEHLNVFLDHSYIKYYHSCQGFFFSSFFFKMIALIRLLFGMSSNVHFGVIGISKVRRCHNVHRESKIWFLFGMNFNVSSKITPDGKTFPTVFTLIWFLFSMNSNM